MQLPSTAIIAVAGVFALRMCGVFMLLPMLAVYAGGLAGATPLLVGLAFGVYGLMQAACQILFGYASDRWGRKPIITLGLLLFAAGGWMAAAADSIRWLLFARGVQGAGAISAATLALAAELTKPAQRTQAMAFIGVGIGAVFLLALMAAPPLQNAIGGRGTFILSGALAVAAIGVLWRWIPTPVVQKPTANFAAASRAVWRDAKLRRLNYGVFFLHLILTAMFVVLPIWLQQTIGLPLAQHWKIYAPVLILSVAGMLVLLRFEARLRGRAVAVAVGLLGAACAVAAAAGEHRAVLVAALWLFFVGFNALEGLLPSLVSRAAAADAKGAALGMFHTFQFVGMFVGGGAAGLIAGWFGAAGVFYGCAAAAGLWLVTAARARN